MLFICAPTFLNYNANMRSLVVDKLSDCDVCIFNRVPDGADTMEFHKIVRGASRRTDIAYESPEGNVVYDDIEDPLPYDVNAREIVIGDSDYALFYRDLSENPSVYENKTVTFKCRALVRNKLPSGTFLCLARLVAFVTSSPCRRHHPEA